ncbi:HAD-IB family hydrolase [Clostridia bacterium]|nr:HAD-IB family hydrolase [Clostridia bacterium]
MKRTAAFFDIDGTLYREGLITEVFKKLIRYEIIDAERWYKEVKLDYDRWDQRVGTYDSYLLGMASIYTEAIKGLHQSQVSFIAKKVVEQKGGRVYTYTRDRINFHKDNRHLLIVVSGSPIELVQEMANKYGFDRHIGSIYKRKNDIYTGEVVPMWDSKSKEEAIYKLVNEYDIDLETSYAYGDTMGDFSMLKMVGNPTIINATKEVYQRITSDEDLRKRINVIVERKDMIYRLVPEHIEVLS